MMANQSYLVKSVLIMHNKCLHADIAHNSVNHFHAAQHTRWLICKQSISFITRYHQIIRSGGSITPEQVDYTGCSTGTGINRNRLIILIVNCMPLDTTTINFLYHHQFVVSLTFINIELLPYYPFSYIDYSYSHMHMILIVYIFSWMFTVS